MLKKPSENGPKAFNILPQWQNFTKFGHTASLPNYEEAIKKMWTTKVCKLK